MQRKNAIINIILALSLVGASEISVYQNKLLRTFKSAWENYDKYPSAENAKELINVLPKEPVNFSVPLFKEILMSETFRKLEINAFSGDRIAARVLFRMLNVSDGAAGEFLSIELGLLMRINPRIFLEELKYNRIFIQRIDSLVGDYGPFMGDEKAMELERLLRIESIDSIKDKELASVREECLRELSKK